MKIYFFLVVFMITFKIKFAESPVYINNWVVWNVGQGLWVTHILPDECHHYDAGGEFGSFKTIKKTLLNYCGYKLNKLNLSHWHYDHFLNIPSLAKSIPKLCWLNWPEFGHTKKPVQKIFTLNIPTCKKSDTALKIWTPATAKDMNASSLIFYTEKVLLTGDSPVQQEKLWVTEFAEPTATKILILGHHGSRTSTGPHLLNHLPNLRLSIASARYAKYKHPHKDTVARLAKFRIPVLKTEDWGNIWFK